MVTVGTQVKIKPTGDEDIDVVRIENEIVVFDGLECEAVCIVLAVDEESIPKAFVRPAFTGTSTPAPNEIGTSIPAPNGPTLVSYRGFRCQLITISEDLDAKG